MGLLFSRDHSRYADIPFDDQINPHALENPLYQQSQHILEQCNQAMDMMENYRGCDEAIAQAMTTFDNIESQRTVLSTIRPNMECIQFFHNLSEEIERFIPDLLTALLPTSSFQENRLLAFKLAQILHFIISFDSIKMRKPEIQNDFSFYRRTISKIPSDPNVIMDTLQASNVSLFVAEYLPVTVKICRRLEFLNKSTSPQDRSNSLASVFARLANSCYAMISRGNFNENPQKMAFALRVLTACIVFYDRIDPIGAFAPGTQIQIRSSLETIHRRDTTNSLCDHIKFSTVHFRSPSTPQFIRNLLS